MFNLREEGKYFLKGAEYIVGVDEVGRGPLAGPVLAVCVLVKKNQKINPILLKDVRDSKKISAKKREFLSTLIFDNFNHIGVALCDNKMIDKINILEASLLAMKKAIASLQLKPDLILIDGRQEIKKMNIPQKAIIKGDSKVFSIAMASIVAKVVRDELMRKYHVIYPDYSFDKHKGYGTKLHLKKLKIHGACPIHRKTFKPVAILLK